MQKMYKKMIESYVKLKGNLADFNQGKSEKRLSNA